MSSPLILHILLSFLYVLIFIKSVKKGLTLLNVIWVIYVVRFFFPAYFIATGAIAFRFNHGFSFELYKIYALSSIILTFCFFMFEKTHMKYRLSYNRDNPSYKNILLNALLIYAVFFFLITDIPLLDFGNIEISRNNLNYQGKRLFLSSHLVDFLLPSLVIIPFIWFRERKNIPLALIYIFYCLLAVVYIGRKSGIALYILSIILTLLLTQGKFYWRLIILVPISLVVLYSLYGYDIDSELLDSVYLRALVMESSSSYIQYTTFKDLIPMGPSILEIPFLKSFGVGTRDLRLETYAMLWSDKVEESNMTGNSQGFGPLFLYLAIGQWWTLALLVMGSLYFAFIKICSDFVKTHRTSSLSFVLSVCLISMSFSAMGTNVFAVTTFPWLFSVRIWIFLFFIFYFYYVTIKKT